MAADRRLDHRALSPARLLATRVLMRVAARGAWAAPTLDAEIRASGISARDAALATEIVYGTLRVLPRIDAAIEAHLSRGKKPDPFLLAALRAGIYQLLHLGRVPPHATVDESVRIVRAERGARPAGFVNAVLRKIERTRPASPRPPERIEVPRWFYESLGSLAPGRREAFLEARPLPPPLGLRVRGSRMTRAEVVRAIRRARPAAEVREAAGSDETLLVRNAGDPRGLPGYAEGALLVQEAGSQLVGRMVGARPGERILDACAGHGGKTFQLLDAVGEGGHVTALDLHETKLDKLEAVCARLGLPVPERLAVDLTVGTGGLTPGFDRVLVDAPCTNLGTIHRRPDVLLRAAEGDPARMAALGQAILATAAELVRPGGLVVYAVCTPTPEEGEGVARAFEESHPLATREVAPGFETDADGVCRLGPWLDDMDAYQVVRFRLGDPVS